MLVLEEVPKGTSAPDKRIGRVDFYIVSGGTLDCPVVRVSYTADIIDGLRRRLFFSIVTKTISVPFTATF